MKNKLSNSLFLLFLFFTTNVYSNPINEINFIGLNNTSENTLLNEMPLKIGDEYSDSASNIIIQSLFKTGLFSDVSLINNKGTLNISLVENPTIKYFDIKLEANSGFTSWLKGEKLLLSKEILDDELKIKELLAGSPFTQRKLDDFIIFLESKYSGSGYYNSKINPNISIDSQNRAGIELMINQGERVKIESFSISGTSQISEEKLLKLFKIGEADMALINYFTKKDLFTEAEFKQGIDLMTNEYFDSGYLDFKIININSELDDEKEKISINIEISEGIQYQLGKVSFEGEIGRASCRERV